MAKKTKSHEPAQADVSDLAILQTVKELQNCTLAILITRLLRGKVGATTLDLGRNHTRLVETGCLEKIGHFSYRVTKTGDDEMVRLKTVKETGQLQPA